MADRADLIQNAVSFLNDPNTQASPIPQRIKFLEAKGLSPAEIDMAFKQASLSAPGPSYGPYPQSYPPAWSMRQRTWDWRDTFITTVVSGSLAYGAVSLFRKYLAPHLQPPSTTAYEEDRDALTAQFDAAEALLKEIQNETVAIRTAVDEQKREVDRTARQVEDVVKEMKEGEAKNRDEMREIRGEIDTIRDMLPKMMDKNKDSQTSSLAELQQELKSLKALLLSRGTPAPSNPGTPIPSMGRPAIPAWQLASNPSSSGLDGINPTQPNGKEKATEQGDSSTPSQ